MSDDDHAFSLRRTNRTTEGYYYEPDDEPQPTPQPTIPSDVLDRIAALERQLAALTAVVDALKERGEL